MSKVPKPAKKQEKKPMPDNSISRLMAEVEQTNPHFVKWLRSRDGKKA